MEGWVRIFKNINGFEPTEDFKPCFFESWMKKIMINNAINVYKANKKHNKLEIYVEERVEKNEEMFETDYTFSEEELIECVQKLPKSLRLIFNMSAIDLYNNKELSEELNMTSDSVKSNLYKARKFLKEELKKIASK